MLNTSSHQLYSLLRNNLNLALIIIGLAIVWTVIAFLKPETSPTVKLRK